MAGAARIGALHVMLGLDSAEFTAGMAKANSGLAKFSKAAKIGFAAVAVAATAAGAALSVAVKGAIDRADDLSKTAQRIGVTTEALSRLSWAADLSDVSLEQLSTGMQRLSRNMLDVSKGAGAQAATAFQALGIAVTDADGKLRSSDAVFADIADRFSRMPDGAEKTALAMQLLGKSGAEMIPLLNSGKDGLAAMAAESDRLGNTLSTSTGKAAEAFNDSITRLQAGLQGMVNRITAAALPTLNNLIDTLTSPDFMAAMQDFAIAAVATADGIAQVFIGAHKAFKDFMGFIGANGDAGTGATYGPGGSKGAFPAEYGAAEASIKRQMEWSWNKGTAMGGGADPYAGFGFNSDGTIKIQETTSAADALRAVFDTLGGSAGSASAGTKALNQAMTDGLSVYQATRTPAEAYSLEVERLNKLLQQGAIDQDTYNRAVKQAQDALKATATTAGDAFNALGELKSMGGNLGSTLASAFASGEDASAAFFKTAMDGLGNLTNKLAEMAGNGLFDLLAKAFGGGNFIGGTAGAPALKLGYQTGIPGFANGTRSAPGGLALVGERGPELINLPRGSQVIPNSDLRRGGASVVRVELSGDLEARILSQTADQSAQIVQAAAPGIAERGANGAGPKLAGGDFDRSMGRFGLTPQAKRR